MIRCEYWLLFKSDVLWMGVMICGGFGVTIHCRLMLRFSLDVVSLFKVDVGCDLWIWFNVNFGS